MARKNNNRQAIRPKAETPQGLQDYFGEAQKFRAQMLAIIAKVFNKYGFDPLETPAIEYLDTLGKFLPDLDRPNEGVFAWKEDDKWLSLRYDMTAPLARVAAQYRNNLPTPYRRYAMGPVWRNEKPGPGRFRQFYQCDADTVGSNSVAADAEMAVMTSEILETLGIGTDDYVIKINNRKILDGILVVAGILEEGAIDSASTTRGAIFRAMDKLDRLGPKGVRLLLGEGRLDESGDFTKGAGLANDQIDPIIHFLELGALPNEEILNSLRELVAETDIGSEGVYELNEILDCIHSQCNKTANFVIDTSVVRGLDYYTGPVLETELTFEVLDKKGRPRRFGSVAGGGRYDDLVKRFTGQRVPATGVSIGVDRLIAALEADKSKLARAHGPVLVTVMDRHRMVDYQGIVAELRKEGIRSEVFLGNARNFGKQLKYADNRNCPLAIIQGEEERNRGVVLIKDLEVGSIVAETASKEEWKSRDWQVEVKVDGLVEKIKELLAKKNLSSFLKSFTVGMGQQ